MNLESFGLAPHATDSVLIGSRYGRLVVLQTGKRPGTYRYHAVCLCDCGNYATPNIRNLKDGRSTSCGCAHRDAVTKHGQWGTQMYKVWKSMHRRCYNKKETRYASYGGRGIKVCDRWHTLDNFIADMEPIYFEGGTIERIDYNGDYEPTNCKWISAPDQAHNKRSNIRLSFNGKTQCLAHWAKETGLPYGTLWERIKVLHWGTERALTTPALDADARCQLARTQCAENRANR